MKMRSRQTESARLGRTGFPDVISSLVLLYAQCNLVRFIFLICRLMYNVYKLCNCV